MQILNYIVLFLVKQARCCLKHAYLNVCGDFQGHLTESWQLQLQLLCGAGAALGLQVNSPCELIWMWLGKKKITPKVKGSEPCKCSAQAYEVLTGLHARTSHGVAGWWNLLSASQRAGSQPAALSLPVCLGGGARRHSSPASGEGARSCPGFCPSPVSASKAEFSMKSYFCTYRLQKNNKVN